MRAPHGFLTEADIDAISPEVAAHLPTVDVWVFEAADGRVDVNEQNFEAHRFYLRYGFMNVGRSETDSAGRPFPIIHMRLK